MDDAKMLTALAVSPSKDGIRLCLRSSDGLVYSLCHNLSSAELRDAMERDRADLLKHESNWFLGNELVFQCHRQSQLCSLIDEQRKWVFYQDIDGTIRERYYGPKREYEPSTWHPTAFEESDVLLGTSLAAVRLAPNDLLMVFFQDREGTIRFRFSRKSLNPSNAGTLKGGLKAKLHSGIAAAKAQDGSGELWLYFQNEDGDLCEYKTAAIVRSSGDSDNPPRPEIILKVVVPRASQGVIQNISVVRAKGQAARIFYQNDINEIVELVEDASNGAWSQGELTISAPTPASITACARETDAGWCLLLYWTTQDEVVYQRLWLNGKWFDPYELTRDKSTEVWEKFWVYYWTIENPIISNATQKASGAGRSYTQPVEVAPSLEGTRLLDADATASNELDDDLIALRAEGVVLTVSRDALCKASALFNDMLSIPQPASPTNEMHDGHPVIPLQESSRDLQLFINTIANESTLNDCSSHALVTILGLAVKYQAGRIFKVVLDGLEHALPNTWAGLVRMLSYSREMGSRDEPRLRAENLLELLQIVLRDDIQILLPSLLWVLSTDEDLSATVGKVHMDSADRTYLLNSVENLKQWAAVKLPSIYPTSGSLRCQTDGACFGASDKATQLLFIPGYDVGDDPPPCCACLSNHWEMHRSGAHKAVLAAWEELPIVLGLQSWDVLRVNREELVEDMLHGCI